MHLTTFFYASQLFAFFLTSNQYFFFKKEEDKEYNQLIGEKKEVREREEREKKNWNKKKNIKISINEDSSKPKLSHCNKYSKFIVDNNEKATHFEY